MKRALGLALLLCLAGCGRGSFFCPVEEAPAPESDDVTYGGSLQALGIVYDPNGCAYVMARTGSGGLRVVGMLPAVNRPTCRSVR
jgi:hypothetical protein